MRPCTEARNRATQLERLSTQQREEIDVLKENLDRAKRDMKEEKRRTDEAAKAAKAGDDDIRELQARGVLSTTALLASTRVPSFSA